MTSALKFPATEMWEETGCDARAAATMKLRHTMVAAGAFQLKPPWACMDGLYVWPQGVPLSNAFVASYSH